MTDRTPHLRAIERADEARKLLEHPLLVETIQAMHDGVIQEWKSAHTTEDRERAWMLQKAIQLLNLRLETIVRNGVYAEKALKAIDQAENKDTSL